MRRQGNGAQQATSIFPSSISISSFVFTTRFVVLKVRLSYFFPFLGGGKREEEEQEFILFFSFN